MHCPCVCIFSKVILAAPAVFYNKTELTIALEFYTEGITSNINKPCQKTEYLVKNTLVSIYFRYIHLQKQTNKKNVQTVEQYIIKT